MHSVSVVRFQHCAIMFKLMEKRPTIYQNKHKTISTFPEHFFVSTKAALFVISAAQFFFVCHFLHTGGQMPGSCLVLSATK
jgi:hypothetical protein